MIVTMPLLRHQHRKKGFTLTEIAIVLAIIGILLGAIWVAAGSVYGSYKVSRAQTAIVSTAQSVHSMYANIRTTAPSAAGTAITAPGMFPNDWPYVGGTKPGVLNPWHPSGAEAYAYVIASGNTKFAIEIDGIDNTSCGVLMSQFNATVSSTTSGTIVGNGTIAGLVGTVVSLGTPTAGTPSIATVPTTWSASSACKGGPTGNSVAIGFDLSLM